MMMIKSGMKKQRDKLNNIIASRFSVFEWWEDTTCRIYV